MRRPVRRIVEGTMRALAIANARFGSLLRSIGPVCGAVRRSTLALLPTLAAIAGEQHTKGAVVAQIDGRSVKFLMIQRRITVIQALNAVRAVVSIVRQSFAIHARRLESGWNCRPWL